MAFASAENSGLELLRVLFLHVRARIVGSSVRGMAKSGNEFPHSKFVTRTWLSPQDGDSGTLETPS